MDPLIKRQLVTAIGLDWDGHRLILAVEMANRESRSSWKDFLLGLRGRGLNGVEFVVADDHAGLRTCRARPMTTACRNCDGIADRRFVEEARCDLAA